MSVTIMVPRPVPPGERVDIGRSYEYPTCDRCLRESSDVNRVMVSPPRPSHNFKEALRGVTRRDALCFECLRLLAGSSR